VPGFGTFFLDRGPMLAHRRDYIPRVSTPFARERRVASGER